MTTVGLGEMFEGDFAEKRTTKITLVSIGGSETPSSVGRRGVLQAEFSGLYQQPLFLIFPLVRLLFSQKKHPSVLKF